MVSVGKARYAVQADVVMRILDPAQEADFHLEGSQAVFRGERFPLIDLHAAGEEGRGLSPLYLLLEGARRRAMVSVDGTEAIREVPAADIAPLPPFIFPRPGRAFRGVFSDGQAPRLLLDQDGIL
ncbi:MAG: chemotaxis protein CheW [Acidobacteria bacterium]|nr:chemotaxis protein CheW [Acidobacteriota bacterium]